MNKPDFDRCTVEATKLLHQQNITDRILDIRNLRYSSKNIIFSSLQEYCALTKQPISNFLSADKLSLIDGCTLYHKEYNIYIVLYNDQMTNFQHLNWTLAHEIGHIYLGHTKDDELEEIEAHFFAAQLFMPEYSLFMIAKEYNSVSAEDLVELFGVSDEAARKRIGTMNRKHLFSASIKDREIWEVQKKRVDLYFNCKRTGDDFRNILSFSLWQDAEYERQARMTAYAGSYYW